MRRLILALLLITCPAVSAQAQDVIRYVGADRKPVAVDQAHPLPVTSGATGSGATGTSAAPIAPTAARGSSALLAKASPGSLFGFDLTEGGTAGYFAFIDASAVPQAGAAISPLACVFAAAGSTNRARQPWGDLYSAGVVVLSTSSCATYTPITPVLIAASVQ